MLKDLSTISTEIEILVRVCRIIQNTMEKRVKVFRASSHIFLSAVRSRLAVKIVAPLALDVQVCRVCHHKQFLV